MKGFKNYSIKKIKEAATLMIKCTLVSIFYIVVTVIANRFNINQLTYFNAVFAILFFSEVLGAAVSSGVSVFINQNIHSPLRIKRYIKIGIIFAFIVAVIYTLLMLVLKEWLFSNIIVVRINDGYLFYYLMIPAIFLNILIRYFENLLNILKEFKSEIFIFFLKEGIILLSIITITIFHKLSIYHIAVLYNLMFLVIIPFIYYVFKYKNQIIKIDLLQLIKIKSKLNSKIIRSIIMVSISDTFWNIGYIIGTLYLLKKGDIIYNSYTYFENVFTFTSGILFSILSVASISICNSIGDRRNRKAYKDSKYALMLTLLIWSFFTILSVSLGKFIMLGANIQIMDVAYSILGVYLIVQLFRFLDWALTFYILNLGGKAKFILGLQVFGLIYLVSLFLLAEYIPNNNYLLIILVGADSIIKTIIGMSYFVSKKWIAYVNDKPSM